MVTGGSGGWKFGEVTEGVDGCQIQGYILMQLRVYNIYNMGMGLTSMRKEPRIIPFLQLRWN